MPFIEGKNKMYLLNKWWDYLWFFDGYGWFTT